MTQIVCIMKSKESYMRIKTSIINAEWEEFLNTLDELQDNIVNCDYDLAIVDEKVWWKDEAISLFKKKGIEIEYFTGDFQDIIDSVQKKCVPDPVPEEIPDYNPSDNSDHDDHNLITSIPPSRVQYIYKDVPVEKVVEKVVLKSRNIKQELFSVLSIDDSNMRDSFSCNMSALLTKEPDTRTLIVDMTNFNNLINHFEVEELNKSDISSFQNLNANNIYECLSKIKGFEHLYLVRFNVNNITKKSIKTLMFAARDFDNIIFTLENDLDNLPVKFTLNMCHKVFIISEPLYSSIKITNSIIESLLQNGQIRENIKIVFSGIEPLEKDDIDYVFKDYCVGIINRSLHLKAINSKKLINNKKELAVYYNLLDINTKKKGFFF